MYKQVIGIDNGVSGTIGIISTYGHTWFFKTPVRKERDYHKTRVQNVKRIDMPALHVKLVSTDNICNSFAFMERPYSNKSRWVACCSALRCWEATLCCLDSLDVKRSPVDSKEWQSHLLPGVTGTEALKEASKVLGMELFPKHAEDIEKHGDADGILIAKWAIETGQNMKG